jgi:hypothetical protein
MTVVIVGIGIVAAGGIVIATVMWPSCCVVVSVMLHLSLSSFCR